MNQIGKNTISMINDINKRIIKKMKARMNNVLIIIIIMGLVRKTIIDRAKTSLNISSFTLKIFHIRVMLITTTLLPISTARNSLKHSAVWSINKQHFEQE